MLFDLAHSIWPTAQQWLSIQTRAKSGGYFDQLPRYARIEADEEERKSAFAASVALCEANLEGNDTPWEPLPAGPHLVATHRQAAPAKAYKPLPLDANEAATRFHQWMIEKGHTGQYGSSRLAALYASHCREERLTKTPENTLRLALKKLPGVAKVQEDKRVGGKGPRPVLWDISAPVSEPMRRYA